MALKGTRTEQNLRSAFAAEAAGNRRYLYFAQQADIEGQTRLAELFRSAAEAETGHAFGHLEFLEQCGDPQTGLPFGDSRSNLRAALQAERDEGVNSYPEMARIAREEGLEDIAAWFETLGRVEKQHAERFERALRELGEPVD
ncbi:rubrerythrin [Thalassospira profundimaris]|uniref:Rubrerythrin n=1 Tax=Thalassospira profundimaris TaxID=502049 RepID=A0A367XKB9_9PROT|nr:rubrerythrin family protein [Thalassospira profundimaris]RCK53869.1 rubrerythrin [Thalassospira profundimaris]